MRCPVTRGACCESYLTDSAPRSSNAPVLRGNKPRTIGRFKPQDLTDARFDRCFILGTVFAPYRTLTDTPSHLSVNVAAERLFCSLWGMLPHSHFE